MKERLDYIDRARGILIILMVIGHVWQRGVVFDTIYAFHMPAFFVISGMLMAHTKSYQKPFGKFLAGKIFAYAIPFIWIECLGILTDILRYGVTLNVKGYLFNTLICDFNDPNLWFLVTLFLIEIFVAGITRIIKKPAGILGIAWGLFFLRYLLPTEVLYVSTLSTAMKYLAFFAAGFCASGLWKRVHVPAAAVCVLVVLACGILESRFRAMGIFCDDLAYVIGGFCGTYGVLCISQLPMGTVVAKLLSRAGENTILIFGTHHIYYAALGIALGVSDFAATPLGTGLVILAGVALLEIPTIYIINRWLPFLAGRRRRKSVSA